ncbi:MULTISPECIES: heparinase II/III family protein [unclassified Streptomyces]|uniref:heparinase II/III domain-containing protein n=1 Tax=unclassified Streptomyces TaxID=2593676 RepID=UPI0033E96B3B
MRSPAERLRAEIRTAAAAAHARTGMPDLPFSRYRRFADDGNRLAYETPYFERRAHVLALAAEALTDPAAPTDDLADALWSVCDEYTWALPAHDLHATALGRGMEQCLDLFAALTAQMLAETVAVCGDRLDARVATRVREHVDRRVLFLLADDERLLPWEGWAHNWAAVCAGASGLAALALWQRGPRLDRLLGRCRRAMETFLSGYGDDGGCAEGVGYWVFGFSHFVYFAEELGQHTGEDLLSRPKVAAIARFPGAVHLGGGLFPAFSDAEERPRIPAGLAHLLTERCGAHFPPEAVDSGMPRDWGDLSRTLRWADGGEPLRGPAPAPVHLPDLAWVVDAVSDVAFAAKGGHNDEPHNHNDLGHFILAAHGEMLLTDLGAGEYQKGYFDAPTRYDFLHNASRGHSVPYIDGREQAYGARNTATVLRHEVHEPPYQGVDFALDLTRAYQVDGLTRLHRTFTWRRGARELLLVDDIDITRPMPYEEVFISRLEPQLPSCDGVLWQTDAANATLRLPPDCTAEIESCPTVGHDGAPDLVYRVRVRVGDGTLPAGRTRLPFVFTTGRRAR